MTTHERENFRSDIQGLRALGVVSVIFYHISPDLLSSGYLGVDIFFVISGFVITSSLAKCQFHSFGEFLLSFIARRIRRLLPALVLCVAVTAVVGLAFIPPDSEYFKHSWKTGIAALFGLSNIKMYISTFDYFGTPADFNLFTQTWSLGVEEQFYVMFSVLLWITGFAQKAPQGKKRLFFTIAMLSTISFGLFKYLSAKDLSAAFYLVTSRFWELGAGSMAFLVQAPIDRKVGSKLSACKTLALLLLIGLLFTRTPFDAEATAAAVVLTAILLVAARTHTLADSILCSKLAVYLGFISYSLYLWHRSVLAISRWTVGVHWWTIRLCNFFSVNWLKADSSS